MSDAKLFYDRYWLDEHIKMNPFDYQPGLWSEGNFEEHMAVFRPYLGSRILDFGCGDGQFLKRVARFCGSVCGVDISDLAVKKARNRFPEIAFDLIGENGKIPYCDQCFDTVCAIDVLEHILDMETALEEINRVIKPGGHLLIATSEMTRVKTLIIAMAYLDTFFYPTSPHIRYFTKKNLSDILRRKGFRVVAYKKNRTYLGFIPKGQLVVAEKVE